MRYLLLALLCLVPSLADAQVAVWGNRTYTSRVCSNPRCAMCASIQAQLAKPVVVAKAAVKATTKAVAATMRRVAYTVSVPVVTRVKRCSNGRCWYENVTTIRVETRYRLEPVEPQASVQPSKEAAQAPTPYEAVAAMIRLINPDESEVLYDLGSGDGRVLVGAATRGCRAVGIELDGDSVEEARAAANIFGVSGKVTVYEGNILDYDLSQCRLVTMYLYPELMMQVAEKLPTGCRVWTYLHGLPGARRHVVDGYEFYEWVKA